jgi:hypothetical protein
LKENLDFGLENEDVWELFNSHSEKLADDDLLLSDQQRASEEADNDAEEQDYMRLKKFTLKESEDNF